MYAGGRAAKRRNAHRDNTVEEGTGQVELEHETDEEPYDDECQNTPEEVRCTGTTQQTVHLIHDTGYQQDINQILKSKIKSQKMHTIISYLLTQKALLFVSSL